MLPEFLSTVLRRIKSLESQKIPCCGIKSVQHKLRNCIQLILYWANKYLDCTSSPDGKTKLSLGTLCQQLTVHVTKNHKPCSWHVYLSHYNFFSVDSCNSSLLNSPNSKPSQNINHYLNYKKKAAFTCLTHFLYDLHIIKSQKLLYSNWGLAEKFFQPRSNMQFSLQKGDYTSNCISIFFLIS